MEFFKSISLQFSPLLVLLVFLGFYSTVVEGFEQKLWLYDDQGNTHNFTNHVRDTSTINLPTIYTACGSGMWTLFGEVNYTGTVTRVGAFENDGLACDSVNGTEFKSFRHLGASDTSVDAISLYSGDNLDGEEILVTDEGKTHFPFDAMSVSATGSATWTLFEGKNLDSTSFCFEVPNPGWAFNIEFVMGLQLDKIRSVFKGCDDREKIEAYKTTHLIVTSYK